jgi:CrcB protein
MQALIYVGLGGFIGSVLRFAFSLLMTHQKLPLHTLFPNMIGSFLIGAFLAMGPEKLGQNLFYFLVPGLLGGFTTYSAFSGELMLMLKSENYLAFTSYLLLSIVLGIVLACLGHWLFKNFLSP